MKQSGVEGVAGHLVTEAALTVLAAVAGGPLAPLLPVLANSLAAGRQQQRVQSALLEIRSTLEAHGERIRDITDEQYKLVNEVVLAVLQTTQVEKLTYLRRAVQNALTLQGLHSQDAIILSRVVRDISSEEVRFLLHAFAYEGVLLDERTVEAEAYPKVLQVQPTSPDSLSITGLLSLGLLAPPETGFDGGTMRFTAIVAKLIALLREPA